MTCWFVEAHANISPLSIKVQGRELCLDDFIKSIFKICLSSDACEPISFKLCLMISMIKHYVLIPVQITMTFTQDDTVMRKLELVQLFFCK